MVQQQVLVSDYTILGSYGELREVIDPLSPAPTDEVVELEVSSATGGTLYLVFKGKRTADIAYNATAAAVKAAIVALTGVESADLTTTGGPLGTAAVAIAWTGDYAGKKVGGLTVNGGGLTGPGAQAALETTTTGDVGGTTQFLANVNQFDGKVTVDRQEIRRSGTRRTGYKRGAISGDGTITGYKVTSRFVRAIAGEMADETNPPAPLTLDVVLDDPESLGVEKIRLHSVKLWELPIGFNVGDVIEEAIPITFEDIEILEEITGEMVG